MPLTRLAAVALLATGCMYPVDLGDHDGGVALFDAGPPDVLAPPCDEPPECPPPSAGAMTLCGRVYDLETTTPVDGVAASPIEVRVVAGDLDPPLATPTVDGCGWFVAPDLAPPLTTRLAILTDDAAAADDHLPTAVTFWSVAGQAKTVNAFATRHATDALWSAAAGEPLPVFGELGLLVPIFVDPTRPPVPPFRGAPAAGVAIAHSVGVDSYFADADPLRRSQLDPALAATGANGTALFVFEGLVELTGQGGEPTGCSWPRTLTRAPPGVVVVLELAAEGCP